MKSASFDSGHWYDEHGKLVTAVPGSNGKLVAPDIRHARKLQLAPGVTGIIKVADKPQLSRWRELEVLKAADLTQRELTESFDSWAAKCMQLSKMAAYAAASVGTEIHSKIELGLQSSSDPWVEKARTELAATGVATSAWRCEWSCVSKLGYATKSDLSADGEVKWVIDIKTKDGDLHDLKTYDDHAMQVAATRVALGWKNEKTKCAILFVRRDQPQARLVHLSDEDVQHGWDCFSSLLLYWQTKNKYVPSWATKLSLQYLAQ